MFVVFFLECLKLSEHLEGHNMGCLCCYLETQKKPENQKDNSQPFEAVLHFTVILCGWELAICHWPI